MTRNFAAVGWLGAGLLALGGTGGCSSDGRANGDGADPTTETTDEQALTVSRDDAIARADYGTWRKRSLAEMEFSGQHEMLNWMALAGAMEALDRKPPVIQDYMETYILASDKCFLSFPA